MSITKSTLASMTLTIAVFAAVSQGEAHEFWISPSDGRVAPGDVISADLKVGLMLKGEPYPYLSNRFQRFEVAIGAERQPITTTEGDLPALDGLAARKGLHIVTHETIAFRARHNDWALFQRYLREEGLAEFEEIHLERGLPKTGFAERYTRYAKALIQAGPVSEKDVDRQTGMKLELTAGANPYRSNTSELPVTLTWQGAPLAYRQISIIHEKAGQTVRTSAVTDVHGRARIPLSGAGEYLLNAVHLEQADGPDVAWESHWATLTYKL